MIGRLQKRLAELEANDGAAQRKARADASMAEMRELRMAEGLVNMDVALGRVREILADSRKTIRKVDWLTPEQKGLVCGIIAELQTKGKR